MDESPLSFATASPPQSKYQKHSEKFIQILKGYQKCDRPPYLHPYQISAVLKTKGLIMEDEATPLIHQLEEPAETKPVLIVAPTGSGKSGMIVLLPYILGSKKVLVLTPSKVISEQLATAFGNRKDRPCFFEKIGMVTKSQKDWKQTLDGLLEEVRLIQGPKEIKERLGNLVIVNAQKFGGRSRLSLVYKNEKIINDVEEFFREFDTLIVDEAHHYPAKTWDKIVKEFSKPVDGLYKKIIFLTATPYKSVKGKEVFILGNEEEAKKRIAYQITPEDVEGVSTRRCEFQEPNHDAQDANVLEDILEIFKQNYNREERISNPQALILVRLKSEAKKLVEFMNERTGREDFAVAILANNPEGLEKFSEGKHKVAVTCGVAKEGYDNSNVVACVILRKIVKGRILFSQFVGRCKRLHRGLGGRIPDQSVGIVLSYPQFEQRRMWDDMEKLAEEDPVEVDDNDV